MGHVAATCPRADSFSAWTNWRLSLEERFVGQAQPLHSAGPARGCPPRSLVHSSLNWLIRESIRLNARSEDPAHPGTEPARPRPVSGLGLGHGPDQLLNGTVNGPAEKTARMRMRMATLIRVKRMVSVRLLARKVSNSSREVTMRIPPTIFRPT